MPDVNVCSLFPSSAAGAVSAQSPRRITRIALFVLLAVLGAAPSLAWCAPSLELVSVKRIWDQAPYNSFVDIIRFHDQWFGVCREGLFHAPKPGRPGDGKLRVIHSEDGSAWTSAALIAEGGADLRDPHLSITGDGRLMIVAGGSKYPGGVYNGRRPRVVFSRDGFHWTSPEPVLNEGDWLWRVTWNKGVAYGIAKYGSPSKEVSTNPRRLRLVKSTDGVRWTTVTSLQVPGGDESTVRFLPDGRMVAFVRCERPEDDRNMIGVSKPPYENWEWHGTANHIGGPNFIVLSDGVMIAGGRLTRNAESQTTIGFMSLESYSPSLVLPSRGDSSYPGFAYHDGLLWVMYYSATEENPSHTAIYLAKVRVGK